jgi:hypothetical protein
MGRGRTEQKSEEERERERGDGRKKAGAEFSDEFVSTILVPREGNICSHA